MRWALPFVGCDKRKQKHAFVIRFARSQITAVPLLFIFLWAPFLLTIDIHFINYFIGNFPLLRIVSSLLDSGQLNSKLPFMKESANSVLTRKRINCLIYMVDFKHSSNRHSQTATWDFLIFRMPRRLNLLAFTWYKKIPHFVRNDKRWGFVRNTIGTKWPTTTHSTLHPPR